MKSEQHIRKKSGLCSRLPAARLGLKVDTDLKFGLKDITKFIPSNYIYFELSSLHTHTHTHTKTLTDFIRKLVQIYNFGGKGMCLNSFF